MSNVYALKPPVDGADPKFAAEGTRMFRRSDVLGAIKKMRHYALRNAQLARDEGRWADVDVQMVRLRTIETVADAILCAPEFENPAQVFALPRDGATLDSLPE